MHNEIKRLAKGLAALGATAVEAANALARFKNEYIELEIKQVAFESAVGVDEVRALAAKIPEMDDDREFGIVLRDLVRVEILRMVSL